MGSTVCQAVLVSQDIELVAAIDPGGTGAVVGKVSISSSAQALVDAGADVAVDFTDATAALANLRFCAERGIHAVCGTTGLSGPEIDDLRRLFTPDGGVNCVWAPNFALGAVIMIHLAEIAARHLDGVEVIELHHDRKRDAPSGTALETARRMTQARVAAGKGDWPADPTEQETVPGARGASAEGTVRVHSVRLPGLVAHQEVIFGAPGQSLSIRHDSYDRFSFMPGVLLAVREVANRPGLTIGLGQLLGL